MKIFVEKNETDMCGKCLYLFFPRLLPDFEFMRFHSGLRNLRLQRGRPGTLPPQTPFLPLSRRLHTLSSFGLNETVQSGQANSTDQKEGVHRTASGPCTHLQEFDDSVVDVFRVDFSRFQLCDNILLGCERLFTAEFSRRLQENRTRSHGSIQAFWQNQPLRTS